MKIETYLNGKLISISDNRTLLQAKNEAISRLKESTTKKIESKYSNFDQINAALGILPPQENNDIKSWVAQIRGEYQTLKQQIQNAQTNDECDGINMI